MTESTLAGRTVLITGAGAGIGAALAEQFGRDGANVVGCDLPDKLERAAAVCDVAVAADVRSRPQLDAVVSTAIDAFGGVDVLIANAGIARLAQIADAEWRDLADVIDVNLVGVLHSIRAVLAPMRSQGSGRIVAVVSRNAEICPAGLASYNLSKAAVISLTRTLAHELSNTNILVNNLIPGPSKTQLNPWGEIDPGACYPTAKLLATLPADGPTGRTFYRGREYPMYARFSCDLDRVMSSHDRRESDFASGPG